jgi:MYXO-CTERM domain-containing protein
MRYSSCAAMRTRAIFLAPVLLAALATEAGAVDRPGYNARYDVAPRQAIAAGVRSAARAAVVGTDVTRGVPTLTLAARPFASPPTTIAQEPVAVARHFLRQRADLYAVTPAVVDGASLVRVHDTGRGGIVVVFRQSVGGIEVLHNDTKVLLTRNLELVAIGGNLRQEASGSANLGSFLLDPDDAIASAFHDLYGKSLTTKAIGKRGGYARFDLAPKSAGDHIFVDPARAKAVWFPVGDTLLPAYYTELFVGRIDSGDSDAYAHVIAADDGRLLFRQNLTQNESFDYRVFAEPGGMNRPLDGPIADFTPHPTGIPDGSFPAFVPPVLVSIEGFNTNPNGVADPWLPNGATQSFGNNVSAYTDDGAPNGFSANDLAATTNGPNAFDRVYDPSLDPEVNDDQRMASVTQLFYVNNWLHDYWYDSGFDEPAGNAQLDNYGRGGADGDALRTEAQDASGMNNANMSTPADGVSPRMQMFLWSERADLALNAAAPLDQSFNTQDATFGPASFDVTAEVVLVDDGTGLVTDACEGIDNDLSGKIALIDRGTCTFQSKVNRAETAGAIGVIIANHTPNAGPMPMPGGGNPQPTIGVLSVSFEDGGTMKAGLGGGPFTATLSRTAGTRPDGTIDNMIVAHEWGHYIHRRLVLCSSKQCGSQSEGWGDFLAMFTTIDESDDWGGTYGDAIYATSTSADSGYYGLRRAPYSIDMGKNGFTFKHIADDELLPSGFPQAGGPQQMSEVHNAGEIWTIMLWEGYYRLLQRTQGPNPAYDFDTARRRMADYVVAGMQLAPPDPTFTEQRDAMLAVASAADLDDMLALADGFAVRGAGSCAESPPRDSTDHIGVVESFSVAPTLTIESVTLSDDINTCDDDAQLDAGERGTLVVEVSNRGPVALDAGTISLSSDTDGVTIAETTLPVSGLDPYATTTITTEVSLSPSVAGPDGLDLELLVQAPDACEPSYSRQEAFRIDYDNLASFGPSSDFDSDIQVMNPAGLESDVIWTRNAYEPLDFVWRGIDIGHISDTRLMTPELEVSADEDLVLTMVHRHRFEFDETTLWDGGVIEIRRVDESNWQDVVDFDDPGYGGPLSNLADNPLSDRMAFVAENASWPSTDTVTVNLGQEFAGDTVELRFRIGTDQAASDFGWEIHSLEFEGIDNTPFPTIVADDTDCMQPPVANAGPDQTVQALARVNLDGSASSDPEGDPLTYAWQQTDGSDVELLDADGIAPSFEAPDEETVLAFELTVSDGTTSHSDSVLITVAPGEPGPEAAKPLVIGNGCGCEVPAAPSERPNAGYLLALGAAAWLRRRRR